MSSSWTSGSVIYVWLDWNSFKYKSILENAWTVCREICLVWLPTLKMHFQAGIRRTLHGAVAYYYACAEMASRRNRSCGMEVVEVPNQTRHGWAARATRILDSFTKRFASKHEDMFVNTLQAPKDKGSRSWLFDCAMRAIAEVQPNLSRIEGAPCRVTAMEVVHPTPKIAGPGSGSKVFHSQTAQNQSRQHVGDVVSQVIIFLTGNETDKPPPPWMAGEPAPPSPAHLALHVLPTLRTYQATVFKLTQHRSSIGARNQEHAGY